MADMQFDDDDGNAGYGAMPEPRRVIWEMEYQDGRKEILFEPELALAALLLAEQVGLNAQWWRKDLPDPDRKMMAVFAHCSDVFAWGCSDAEDIPYAELRPLYEAWVKDPAWGVAVWCIQRRGTLPQAPLAKLIRAAGIWDLDTMGLRSNRYDGVCAHMAADRHAAASAWENEGGAASG